MNKKLSYATAFIALCILSGIAYLTSQNYLASNIIQMPTGNSLAQGGPSPVKIGASYIPVLTHYKEKSLTEIIGEYPGRVPLISNDEITGSEFLKKEAQKAQEGGIDFFAVRIEDISQKKSQDFLETFQEALPENFSYALSLDIAPAISSGSTLQKVKSYLQHSHYLKSKSGKPLVYINDIESVILSLDQVSILDGKAFPKTKIALDNLKSELQAEFIVISDLETQIQGSAPFDEEAYMSVYEDIRKAVSNKIIESAESHYNVTKTSENRTGSVEYKNYFLEKRLPLLLLSRYEELGIKEIVGASGLLHFQNNQPLAFYAGYSKFMQHKINTLARHKGSTHFIPTLLVSWNNRFLKQSKENKSFPPIIEGHTPEEFVELADVYIKSLHLQGVLPETFLINSWNDYAHMDPLIPTRQWNLEYLKTIQTIRKLFQETYGATPIKKHRILYLGNSLTLHPPLADSSWDGLSWDGNWGMAATRPENDYVHQTTALLAKQNIFSLPLVPGKDMTSGGGTVYGFLNKARLFEVEKLNPDIVVVQLSENKENPTNPALELQSFETNYRSLLQALSSKNRKIFTISNWGETNATDPKNTIIKNLSNEFGAIFVDISSIAADSSMHPDGSENWMPGVLWHPGDRGMKAIAEKLSTQIISTLKN